MSQEKCRQCGCTGTIGAEIVPYLVGRNKKGKPMHRWLCGLQTGRECSRLWHERYSEHLKANA